MLAFGVLHGLAALLWTPGPAADNWPRPEPSASVPTFTPAPAAPTGAPVPLDDRSVRAPFCKGGEPAIEVALADAAAGNRYVVVTVHNCGSTTLTLQNKPTVTAITGRGDKLVLAEGGAVQQPFVVPTGGSGYFGLHYRGGGSSDDPDGRVNRVDYTIPEVGTATVLEFTDLAADSDAEVTTWFPSPDHVFG